MSNDFDEVAVKFQKLATALSGPAIKQIGNEVGLAAKDDIAKEVRKDAGGDQAMRGWRRGNPIKISGRYDFKGTTSIVIAPAKGTAGPMRVLNDGRNQGNAPGFSGPGVSKDGTTKRTKSGGVRKVRARQSKRWNGRTRGKGTWDDAIEVIVKETPQRAMDVLMDKSVRKIFKG